MEIIDLAGFEGNERRFPAKWIRDSRHLWRAGAGMRTHAEHVVVLLEGEIVADQPRNFRRDQIIYDPWHYLPVLVKKPRTLRNGAPFNDWMLPPALTLVRAKLKSHTDHGSQYTSEQFQRLMADNGIVCSMSRSGNCWDNAAMESFFSSLKTERTANKTYRARNEAKADVFDDIERFYNLRR